MIALECIAIAILALVAAFLAFVLWGMLWRKERR